MKELIILEIGGFEGYTGCISQWQMSQMCIGEILTLKLSGTGDSVNFVNSNGFTIGCYPPEETHHNDLLQRLKEGQEFVA